MSDAELTATFAAAGVRGWLHARPVRGVGPEVGLDPDEAVPMSSLYKLPLLVAYARMVDAGSLDPVQPVTVSVAGRTAGPTGLSILRDPVTMSWRDLVTQMIVVSDNAAADVVLREVGLDRVTATLRDLGLHATTVTGGTAEAWDGLIADTATASLADAFSVLADVDRAAEPAGYDPLRASASSARDMTRLLAAVWDDRAASPEQCAFARDVLALRVGPHRLRAGFPLDDTRLADKTGTLGALRHDVGVVQLRAEEPYAVAVFTRAARPDRILPAADAVIGAAARVAVDRLRHGS